MSQLEREYIFHIPVGHKLCIVHFSQTPDNVNKYKKSADIKSRWQAP